jgi:hypothetical protein
VLGEGRAVSSKSRSRDLVVAQTFFRGPSLLASTVEERHGARSVATHLA